MARPRPRIHASTRECKPVRARALTRTHAHAHTRNVARAQLAMMVMSVPHAAVPSVATAVISG
eukprot:3813680-Pleurochrysis_carterae.AAC.1